MRQVGRRSGFMAGVVVAMAGGVLSGMAIVDPSFWLFFLGMTLIGFAAAFSQQYRFAAADVGSEAERARAISWVLSGGIASAVIGPQIVIFGGDLLAPIPFAGAFFAIPVLGLLGLVVLALLGGQARAAPDASQSGGGRPLVEIARQPRFIVAVLCAMGAYALMSLVMTAAPLAMVACGLGENNAALGIQWHVLAMFAPSFFTGMLIARFGIEPIVVVGLALLAACAAVALAGIGLSNFWSRSSFSASAGTSPLSARPPC